MKRKKLNSRNENLETDGKWTKMEKKGRKKVTTGATVEAATVRVMMPEERQEQRRAGDRVGAAGGGMLGDKQRTMGERQQASPLGVA